MRSVQVVITGASSFSRSAFGAWRPPLRPGWNPTTAHRRDSDVPNLAACRSSTIPGESRSGDTPSGRLDESEMVRGIGTVDADARVAPHGPHR